METDTDTIRENQRTIGTVSLTWVLNISWIRTKWEILCRSIWNKFYPVINMVKVNPGSSYENVGSTRLPDAVYQVSRSSASWFRRRRFMKYFIKNGQWLCDLKHLNKFSFPTSYEGSIWNLASIGLAVSEQKKLNVESEWPWTKVSEWHWPLIFIKFHLLI